MSRFCSISINEILSIGDILSFDIYIQLSKEKIIKLENQEAKIDQRLIQYRDKGLKEVLAVKEEYVNHVKDYKEKFLSKFTASNNNYQQQEVFTFLNQAQQLAQITLKSVGLNDDALEIVVEVNKQAIALIQRTPSIFKFFNDFKERSSHYFLRSILTSFTMTTIIETFNNTSEKTKENASLAAMLADILLEEKEIEIAKNRNALPYKKLGERIFQNPFKLTEILKQKSVAFAQETMTILEQCHERPDGKGYPKGIDYNEVSPLSACYIVSCHFIDLLVEHNFSPTQKDQILMKLTKEYFQGPYKDAMDGLQKVLG